MDLTDPKLPAEELPLNELAERPERTWGEAMRAYHEGSRLSPRAMEAARRYAAEDRDALARLRAAGVVKRDDTGNASASFVKDIEDRAFPRRTRGQDTIRPNRRKKSKGRR